MKGTMNPAKICFLIDDNTCLRYFYSAIKQLCEQSVHKIVLIGRTYELVQDIRNYFPDCDLDTGYFPIFVDLYSPDLIVCNQIWWWEIRPLLNEAVALNIPVIHYEHGSLIYTSEYLLEGDEYKTAYRNDTYLCSHIACWGERDRECWISYGVPEEKIHLTGAMHLDHLYEKPDRELVYKTLEVGLEKKILFVYTSLTGQTPHFDDAQKVFISKLEEYTALNPEYQLVVKPHPAEMLWYENPLYSYAPSTIIIANPIEDCGWRDVIRIPVEAVLSVSQSVISPFSSALISPLSMNIPIILIEYNSALVEDFSFYCRSVVTVVKDREQIPEAIHTAVSRKGYDSAKLARQFNFNNDGHATDRFANLIETVLDDKALGKKFYPRHEEELLQSVRRYPFLPYPYQHLIKYYMNEKKYLLIDYWLDQYCQKFRDPAGLIRELALYFFEVQKDFKRAGEYLRLFARYKKLDFELLQMYKLTLYGSETIEENQEMLGEHNGDGRDGRLR